MDPQRRIEILLEENELMTGFRERDIKKVEAEFQQAKEQYEKALGEVKPFREKVYEALGHVGRSDVHEIGSFVKPPKPIQALCQCLSILLGLEEEGWEAMHIQMRDPSFLRHLRELDLDAIPHKQSSKAKGTIKDITEDEMNKVCVSGISLLAYVKAVLGYCQASKKSHLLQKKDQLSKSDGVHIQKRKELDKMYKERVLLENTLKELKNGKNPDIEPVTEGEPETMVDN